MTAPSRYPGRPRAALAVLLAAALPALGGAVLQAASRVPLSPDALFLAVDAMVGLVYGTVAAVVLSRRSHPAVWLIALAAVGGGLAALGGGWASFASSHSAPAADAAIRLFGSAWVPGTLSLFLVLPWLVRETPLSAAARLGAAAGAVTVLAFTAQRVLLPMWDNTALLLLIVAMGLVTAAAVLHRHRRGPLGERAGLGLLALGTAVMALSFLPLLLAPHTSPALMLLVPLLHLACQALFPGALLVTMLRNRLWGIDLAVSRAVLAGLLTLGMVLIYAALVWAASAVVGSSGAAQVIAAVGVVLAVQPVRTWLGARVRRMVWGEAASPGRAALRIGASLSSGEDATELLDRLAAAVGETLRLESVVLLAEGVQAGDLVSQATVPDARRRASAMHTGAAAPSARAPQRLEPVEGGAPAPMGGPEGTAPVGSGGAAVGRWGAATGPALEVAVRRHTAAEAGNGVGNGNRAGDGNVTRTVSGGGKGAVPAAVTGPTPGTGSTALTAGSLAGRLFVTPRPGEQLDRRTLAALDGLRPILAAGLDLVRAAEDVARARDAADRARETADRAREAADRAREAAESARLAERKRIRRELHDGIGPWLSGLRLGLQGARNVLAADPAGADAVLAALQEEAAHRVQDVRLLSRSLLPPVLEARGLGAALEELAAHHARSGFTLEVRLETEGTGAPAGAEADALRDLDPRVAAAAYAVIAESALNAARHSRADLCTVEVTLEPGEGLGFLRVVCRDAGRGRPADAPDGVGTISMRERVQELGGAFSVGPAPDGADADRPGTLVTATIPLAPAEAAT
ncbi:sensor histidine kinase [Brevibacterium album]|uniref:sensor histidine kinase n=1 Tax=Brevibacterium album TaxID=417948 RepID=UPI00041FCF5D|nr:histidine kinase [Brevibacterium album]